MLINVSNFCLSPQKPRGSKSMRICMAQVDKRELRAILSVRRANLK
jgi:hypothetical protein